MIAWVVSMACRLGCLIFGHPPTAIYRITEMRVGEECTVACCAVCDREARP